MQRDLEVGHQEKEVSLGRSMCRLVGLSSLSVSVSVRKYTGGMVGHCPVVGWGFRLVVGSMDMSVGGVVGQ